MRERTTNRSGRGPSRRDCKPVEQPEAPPGYVVEPDLAADAMRKRMAEYCQRAAAQHKPMEIAPALIHQGEFYLPGVF